MKPILFTGLRPTGDLHLGHYASIIKPLAQYKNDFRLFVMIADLHAQTELRKAKVDISSHNDAIEESTKLAVQTLGSFLPTSDFVVFRQSDLKEYHLNLFYKLLMISRHNQTFGNPVFLDAMKSELFGEIDVLTLRDVVKDRIKSFIDITPEMLWGSISLSMTNKLIEHLAVLDWGYNKLTRPLIEKTVKHLNTRIGVMGFASYPILMAADIILYQPEYTLVGKDQNPHIQITNDLVKLINKTFGFSLKPTESMIVSAQTLKGNDGLKMSKSVGNTITINDLLRNDGFGFYFFAKMKSFPRRLNEQGRADQCLVSQYWDEFGPSDITSTCSSGSIGCLECKQLLFESIRSMLKKELVFNRSFETVADLLNHGAEVAQKRIEEGELIKKQFI